MHVGDVVFISINIPVPQSGILSKFVSRFVLPGICLQICSLQIHVRICRRGHGSCGHRAGRTARQTEQAFASLYWCL